MGKRNIRHGSKGLGYCVQQACGWAKRRRSRDFPPAGDGVDARIVGFPEFDVVEGLEDVCFDCIEIGGSGKGHN